MKNINAPRNAPLFWAIVVSPITVTGYVKSENAPKCTNFGRKCTNFGNSLTIFIWQRCRLSSWCQKVTPSDGPILTILVHFYSKCTTLHQKVHHRKSLSNKDLSRLGAFLRLGALFLVSLWKEESSKFTTILKISADPKINAPLHQPCRSWKNFPIWGFCRILWSI